MIFQDPMTSLNPTLTIGTQITRDAPRATWGSRRREARASGRSSCSRRCGIPDAERRLDDYPHQFSGGMRQRVMIAIALSCKPKLLIADEPTTALDVTIQAQILDLLDELRREHGMAMILITHDMGVVAQVADEVAVMYAGQIVEQARCSSCSTTPSTRTREALLGALPQLDDHGLRERPADRDPRPPARPHRPAPGVPLRAALPVRGHPTTAPSEPPELRELRPGHFVGAASASGRAEPVRARDRRAPADHGRDAQTAAAPRGREPQEALPGEEGASCSSGPSTSSGRSTTSSSRSRRARRSGSSASPAPASRRPATASSSCCSRPRGSVQLHGRRS